jgi:hypothetical protein
MAANENCRSLEKYYDVIKSPQLSGSGPHVPVSGTSLTRVCTHPVRFAVVHANPVVCATRTRIATFRTYRYLALKMRVYTSQIRETHFLGL